MSSDGDTLAQSDRSFPGTAVISNQCRSPSVVASSTVGPGKFSRFIQPSRSISCGSSLCTPIGSDFTNRSFASAPRTRKTSAPDSPTVWRSIVAPSNCRDHWEGKFISPLLSYRQKQPSSLPAPFLARQHSSPASIRQEFRYRLMGRLQVVMTGLKKSVHGMSEDGSSRFAALKKTQISTLFFG